MATIHCSKLPRFMRCPASIQPPKLLIGGDSEPARIGSAVHELLASHVRGADSPDLVGVAKKYRVELDSIKPLYYIGRNIWNELSDSIKVLYVEKQLSTHLTEREDHELMGTADVLGETVAEDEPTALVILDWKSGTASADYRDQFMGYGLLGFVAGATDAKNAKIITVWLRDQTVEVEDVTLEEVREWSKELVKNFGKPDLYNPSAEACLYCNRQHECPARRELVQRSAADFLQVSGEKMKALAPADLVKLQPKAKLLEKVLKQYDATLRATLGQHGFMPIGDGREIGFIEQDREKLVPNIAIDVAVHMDVDPSPAVTISKSKLCDLVGKKAPRGMKSKVIAAFMDECAVRGGVTKTPTKSLRIRKIEKEKEKADG